MQHYSLLSLARHALTGHRDWAPTECPGNSFYPQLPQLRIDVAAAMGDS